MADSERSFIDRFQKTTSLIAAATGLVPTYAPLDPLMTIALVTARNNACETLNAAVATAITNWSGPVQNRIAQVVLIKARSTALLNYIKTNPAWKDKFGRAKVLADSIRNIKPPRKTTPPTDPPTPASTATHKRGAQSYFEIEANWKSFVNLATGLPGYSPPIANAPLQAANLNNLLSAMAAVNDAIPPLEEALAAARSQRYDAYYGLDGLKAKFTGMKNAIKGQYSPPSTQWTQVKGIIW